MKKRRINQRLIYSNKCVHSGQLRINRQKMSRLCYLHLEQSYQENTNTNTVSEVMFDHMCEKVVLLASKHNQQSINNNNGDEMFFS